MDRAAGPLFDPVTGHGQRGVERQQAEPRIAAERHFRQASADRPQAKLALDHDRTGADLPEQQLVGLDAGWPIGLVAGCGPVQR